MSRLQSIVLTLTLFIISPFLTHAQQPIDVEPVENVEIHGFNLSIISMGINHYYFDHDEFPQSVAVLRDEGYIPSNMNHSVTGREFNYDPEEVAEGDFAIKYVDETHISIHSIHPSGFEFEIEVERPEQPELYEDENDRFMLLYFFRVQRALFYYGENYGEIPVSIEALAANGCWPFDGFEINPYTNEPLQFDCLDIGCIELNFLMDRIHCSMYLLNGIVLSFPLTASMIDQLRNDAGTF